MRSPQARGGSGSRPSTIGACVAVSKTLTTRRSPHGWLTCQVGNLIAFASRSNAPACISFGEEQIADPRPITAWRVAGSSSSPTTRKRGSSRPGRRIRYARHHGARRGCTPREMIRHSSVGRQCQVTRNLWRGAAAPAVGEPPPRRDRLPRHEEEADAPQRTPSHPLVHRPRAQLLMLRLVGLCFDPFRQLDPQAGIAWQTQRRHRGTRHRSEHSEPNADRVGLYARRSFFPSTCGLWCPSSSRCASRRRSISAHPDTSARRKSSRLARAGSVFGRLPDVQEWMAPRSAVLYPL